MTIAFDYDHMAYKAFLNLLSFDYRKYRVDYVVEVSPTFKAIIGLWKHEFESILTSNTQRAAERVEHHSNGKSQEAASSEEG